MSGITLINPGNQQGLRYLFDIADPQSNPENIDMTAIQPVVDMNFGGFAKLHDYTNLLSCAEPASSIAGVQSKTWTILCYGNATTADQQVIVPVGHHFVSFGIKMHIYFNAAGAAAVNGKYISSEVLMIAPSGTEITRYHMTFVAASGCLLYAPGFQNTEVINRQHLCVVPAGSKINVVFWLQDGTNFPAATVVRYALVGQAIPVGSPLPIGV